MSDEDAIELVESVKGCIVKKIEHGETQKRVYFWAPNDKARISALDMAYRLKGKYAPEKYKLIDKYSEMSDEELQEEQKKAEALQQRYNQD